MIGYRLFIRAAYAEDSDRYDDPLIQKFSIMPSGVLSVTTHDGSQRFYSPSCWCWVEPDDGEES